MAVRLIQTATGNHNGTPMLSERQAQVLALVGEGKTNKEIAGELGLSPETVSSYRKIIRQKLDLHSTAALAAVSVNKRLRTAKPRDTPAEGY